MAALPKSGPKGHCFIKRRQAIALAPALSAPPFPSAAATAAPPPPRRASRSSILRVDAAMLLWPWPYQALQDAQGGYRSESPDVLT